MRVCIIGTGAISGVHASALKSINAQIAAVCDVDAKKAYDFIRNNDIDCPVYEDYKEMLSKTRPDAVHILTPHYLHAEMALFALSENINVLSEKPVCINFDQLKALLNAAKQSKAQYGVCFQNRYLSANRKAYDFVSKSKVFGADGAVVWSRDAKYYASGEWRGKWATEGGGVLINQSIHTLDLMVHALGRPVKVTASIKNVHLRDVIEVEDSAELLLYYPGFTAKFTATTAAKGSYPVVTNFYTDAGIAETRGDEFALSGEKSGGDDAGHIGKAEWGAGHAMLIEDYYACLAAGKPVNCGIDGCVDTMLTVFAAYLSARRGQPVFLEELSL